MIADRVRYLDGLRGFAILGVIFFHAYSRWSSIETFQQEAFFTDFFAYGWLGVQLFFAISGYVIYMSLLKSSNLLIFGFARYLRLAPAMLIAAVLIYVTSFYIVERPLGVANLVDLLPSVTFVDPGLLGKILGIDIRSLDGAFWSLYIEVKFYVVAAVLFFVFKDKNLLGLGIMFALWIAIKIITVLLGVNNHLILLTLNVLDYAGVKYYGWFLLGVLAYRYQVKVTTRNAALLLMVAGLAIVSTGTQNIEILVAASVAAALFILPLFNSYVRKTLSSTVLLFFGYISYPLYLIHQNIVTGLAIKLHDFIPGIPTYFYPLPFIGMVVLAAFIIARMEPYLKRYLLELLPDVIFGCKIKRDNR